MGNACIRCWHHRVSVVEQILIKAFRKWGYFVSKHPLLVIILSTIIGIALATAILRIETETEIDKLFAPSGTQSSKNYQRYQDTYKIYQDNTLIQSIFLTNKDNINFDSQQNIFTLNHLTELLKLHQSIINVSVQYNDSITYNFNDLCYKYENGNCRISSVLQFYDFNQTILDNKFSSNVTLMDIISGNFISYPAQYSSYSGSNVLLLFIFGQNITTITVSEIDVVTEAPAFGLSYVLDGSVFDADLLDQWEDNLIALLDQENNDNDLYDITYMTSNSFNKELSRAVASDVTSFALAFVLIGTFAGLVLLRFKRRNKQQCLYTCCRFTINNKRSRGCVSLAGVVSTMLAIAAGFGLVGGIFGVKFNSVVSVGPFLLVGLGVDDMFVLVRAYELTSSSMDISERIALTMERGGISILFTSITDLIAFCVGASSPFGAISAFCVYCGVGVFMDFLFQISFFLAALVYDSRNQQNGICKKAPVDPANIEMAISATDDHDATVTKNNNIKDLTVNDHDEKEELNESENKAIEFIYLADMIDPSSSSIIMEKLGGFLLKSIWIKLIILFFFVLYLIGAIFGILSLHAFQDPTDLAPNDSYLRLFYSTRESYFNAIGIPMQFVFDKELDYYDEDVFNDIDQFVSSLQNDECFESDSVYTKSWIHSYKEYLNQKHGNQTMDMDQYTFYDILYNEYLINDIGETYIQDIWNTIVTQQIGSDSIDISNDNDTSPFDISIIGPSSYKYINSSRIWVNLMPIGTGTDLIQDCLDNFKSLTNEFRDELGSYYYAFLTVFAESDLITIQQTIFNLLYAMIAACIITIILIPYPTMAIFVMSTICQILFGVLGYMSLWGLPINTTTMVNVVISVGFSVDNSAHFCHAFMNAPINKIKLKNGNKLSNQDQRNMRVLFALNSVGMPILAGDLSTMIALLPLSSAESEIFTSFFKCISLVMLFAASYAVLYLPVILSLIGPVGYSDIINNENNENNENATNASIEEEKNQDGNATNIDALEQDDV